MGKVKQNKRKRKNKNPTGLPSVKDIQNEEAELSAKSLANVYRGKNAIKAVIEQLQGSTEDKIFGLSSIASVFDKHPEMVVQNRIIRIAAPLLLDNDPVVRHAAAGALRNLSACGDPDLCDLLVQQDIMTSLGALIQKYADDWQECGDKKIVSEYTDTFIQAVHLLLNLCENNTTALMYLNEDNIKILARCLDVQKYGIETAVAVAQCLHTITENNPIAIKVLQNMETTWHSLLELEGKETEFLLFRVLICGLALNIRAKICTARILAVLGSVLEVDHCQVLDTLATSLAQSKDDDKVIEDTEKLKEQEKCIADTQTLFEGQQTCLEILTNICSGDDDEDSTMEIDSSETSDNILSDSSIPDDEPPSYETSVVTLSAEVHEAVVHHQLVQKVWMKIAFPPENVCKLLQENTETLNIYNRAKVVRCRALLCLNNLLTCLDVSDFEGEKGLYKMWVDIATLREDSNDTALMEAVTAAMRAILQKSAPLAPSCFKDMTQSDLKVLLEWTQQCSDPSARANLLKISGILGMMKGDSSTLKVVGNFLLDTASKETELWVTAETLDTIMDVFAEDETDLAAAEISLVDRLKGLVPGLKHKVRSKKKSLGEHYITVTTVCTNLNRFIQYKGKRVALIKQSNGHS
ncbi:HEAT repeat-containing protein 3 [Schistocerca cancellata]|uniref:HEAT repeat-containing protein 3 n=1 Tax=Schistocerca cancellata TaxID=274614 RepID=UPI002117D81D|nr:HEAT repeat-containing protein 3 [Schistocerca cancellata]XP_049777193.1 HEAT repeat-containing protein 3 [Schistocerca cancellata]